VQNTAATFWGVIVPSEPPGARGGSADTKVTFASIRDGTANTFLLGERWMRPDQYRGGAWNDDHGIMSGLDQDQLRVGDQPPVRDTDMNPITGNFVTVGQNNPCCDWWRDPDTRSPSPRLGSRFGGPHTGGMTSVFCDGSVRTINWSITQPVFLAVTRKDDGAVINWSLVE
jgi:prepilin-type processing-associated H-X9-DG protein